MSGIIERVYMAIGILFGTFFYKKIAPCQNLVSPSWARPTAWPMAMAMAMAAAMAVSRPGYAYRGRPPRKSTFY